MLSRGDIKEFKFDFQFLRNLIDDIQQHPHCFHHVMVVALIGDNHRMQPEPFSPAFDCFPVAGITWSCAGRIWLPPGCRSNSLPVRRSPGLYRKQISSGKSLTLSIIEISSIFRIQPPSAAAISKIAAVVLFEENMMSSPRKPFLRANSSSGVMRNPARNPVFHDLQNCRRGQRFYAYIL